MVGQEVYYDGRCPVSSIHDNLLKARQTSAASCAVLMPSLAIIMSCVLSKVLECYSTRDT